MAERRLIIFIIGILFLIYINTVNVEEVAMQVDNKHIIGMGTGNNPIGEFVNVVYVFQKEK